MTTIEGTLTYRADTGGYWLLQLPSGHDLIGRNLPPTLDRHTLIEQLKAAIKPIADRELIVDAFIRVIDPDGTDRLGQRPPEGLLLGALRIRDGEIIPAVTR